MHPPPTLSISARARPLLLLLLSALVGAWVLPRPLAAQDPDPPAPADTDSAAEVRQRAIHVLIRLMVVKTDSRAAAALTMLGPEALTALLEEFASESRADRREMMMEVVARMDGLALAEAGLFPQLVAGWRTACAADDWGSRRELVERTIAALGGGMADVLLDCLDAPDVPAGVHALAHRALRNTPHPPDSRRMRDYIDAVLHGDDADARLVACRMLGRIDDSTALLDVIDRQPGLRRAALEAMFDLCSPSRLSAVMPRLLAAACLAIDVDADVARRIGWVLTRVEEADWRAARELRWFREMPDAQVNVWLRLLVSAPGDETAIQVLHGIGPHAARPLCDYLISHEPSRASDAVANALRSLPGEWPVEVERLATALAAVDRDDTATTLLIALADRSTSQLAPVAQAVADWTARHPEFAAAELAVLLLARAPEPDRWMALLTDVYRASRLAPVRLAVLHAWQDVGVPWPDAVELLMPEMNAPLAGDAWKAEVLGALTALADPADQRMPDLFLWAAKAGAMHNLLVLIAEHKRERMGPFMVPMLGAPTLSDDTYKLMSQLGHSLVPYLLARRSDDRLTAERALNVVIMIGPLEEDLPELRKWWDDQYLLRDRVALAMGQTHKAGIPMLKALLATDPGEPEATYLKRGLVEAGDLQWPDEVARLLDDDESVRAGAMEMLQSAHPGADELRAVADGLRAALTSPHDDVQQTAAQLLWKIDSDDARRWWMQQMETHETLWWTAAGMFIDRDRDPQAVYARLLNRVESGSLTFQQFKWWLDNRQQSHAMALAPAGPDDRKRPEAEDPWQVLTDLARAGVARRTILRLLVEPWLTVNELNDEPQRRYAFLPLGQAWLSDADAPADVKRDAAILLARAFGDAAGTDWLANQLAANEPDADQRRVAAESLLLAGDARGVPFLADLADDDHPRSQALLVAIGNEAALSRLRRAGGSLFDDANFHAIQLLGQYASPALLPLLREWDTLDRRTRWESHGWVMMELLTRILLDR